MFQLKTTMNTDEQSFLNDLDKKLFLLPILFLSLISTPCLSENSITKRGLVERDGIYYKKFTDVPYTGKVTGKEQGSYKNGVMEGEFVSYYDNGKLQEKVSYKNGVKVSD